MKYFYKNDIFPCRRKSNRSTYAEYWNGYSWNRVSIGWRWFLKNGYTILTEDQILMFFPTLPIVHIKNYFVTDLVTGKIQSGLFNEFHMDEANQHLFEYKTDYSEIHGITLFAAVYLVNRWNQMSSIYKYTIDTTGY